MGMGFKSDSLTIVEMLDAEAPPLAKLSPWEALASGLWLGGGEGMPMYSAVKEADEGMEVEHSEFQGTSESDNLSN